MNLILGDCLKKMKELEDNSVDSIVTDPPYGISFMSKKWDYDVPKVEVWKEVLRVLKPGGHMLCACGTRTQHRMAVNLEDAGFEIRDIVAWVYGSGFPKSHNIGKAVDKLQGNKRKVIAKGFAYGMSKGQKDAGYRPDDYESKQLSNEPIGKDAQKWNGWGTALKPAMELWTLCRKPLSEKTIASNCLKWGTGGINIDGCRVETEENLKRPINENTGDTWDNKNCGLRKTGIYGSETGRFPANLIHDGSDEVVSGFPDSKSTPFNAKKCNNPKTSWKMTSQKYAPKGGFSDSGSASRFFYCAKASKSERNKGLEGFEEKQQDESRKEGNPGGDNPRNRGVNKTQNFHPTVKPVKLMRYLCRLITPKGGVILDPFMGSGTTGIGAKLEGFEFIGIEMNEEYMEIAEARIENWKIEEQLRLDKEE